MLFITGRNEVVAKVIFLHLFVILFTGGGGVSQHALQEVSQHALQQVSRGGVLSQHALQDLSQHALQQVSRRGGWHTVNERPVRILLECILVLNLIANIFKIAAGH